MALKNSKNHHKNINQSNLQINPSSYLFFTNFKDKKIQNTNFSHQMKTFNTNIIYFSGLNRYQQYCSHPISMAISPSLPLSSESSSILLFISFKLEV